MKIYLVDAKCHQCGETGRLLFRVVHKSERGEVVSNRGHYCLPCADAELRSATAKARAA